MTVGSGSSQFTAKVLSADEAAGYTYENIIARGIDPKQYMQTPRHYYGYLGWYYFKLECNRRSCRLCYFCEWRLFGTDYRNFGICYDCC